MTRLLRAVAIMIAVAAAVDPSWTVERAQSPAVDIRAGALAPGGPRRVSALREDLGAAVNGTTAQPSAIVLVDPAAQDLRDIPSGIPLSVVRTGFDPDAPAILDVAAPSSVLLGQSARIDVAAEAARGTMITLERNGVVLDRHEVRAPGAAQPVRASLRFAPPSAGLHHLRLVLKGADGVRHAVAHVGVTARAESVRVLVHETRPSWSAAFVRRALEGDGLFAVDGAASASRGIEVTAGAAPPLASREIDRYAVVVIGAPEGLTRGEVDGLDRFVRERGGAVVLIPDRRPTGAYTRWLPGGLSEVLIDRATGLTGAPGLRASELMVMPDPPPDILTHASIERSGALQPVIWTRYAGAGQIGYSGALDAWRNRTGRSGEFARFWAAFVADLAAAAPTAIDARLDRAVLAPGAPGRVRVALRPTAFARDGDDVRIPPVAGRVVDAAGRETFVRLWPTGAAGEFEGAFALTEPGAYQFEAWSGDARIARPLLADSAVTGGTSADRLVDGIAAASGGVVVAAADLQPLRAHLRSLEPATGEALLRPMRSAAWFPVFAALLAAEWFARRRKGLR